MSRVSERWLVTGAGGFIGQRLVALLRAGGVSVAAWRRGDADLADPDAVGRAMAQAAPTHIVHLAAGPPAPAVADWRYVVHDPVMVSNLASAMPAQCRLLHAGSMAEFGRSGRFDEAAICRPSSAYGAAKAAATDRAIALRMTTGRTIGVARLFGVYGPGEAAHRLVPHVARALAAGRHVPLSPGDQVRDFVHVDDVCATLIALARDPEMPALVNVGTGIGLAVRQVCEIVADLLDASRDLLGFGEMPYRVVDEAELVADTRLLARHAPVPPQRWCNPARLADEVRAIAAEHRLAVM